MQRQNFDWFGWSVGAILLLTGLAKISSSFGHPKILALADPILGIRFGTLLPLVGTVELVIASCCISTRVSSRLKAGLVAWLATTFLIYRVGLLCMDWHHPCPCLGNLTDAIHVSPQVAEYVMKSVLAYLFIGSYATLFRLWWQKRKVSTSAFPADASSATV
jgi:hypothetical protein